MAALDPFRDPGPFFVKRDTEHPHRPLRPICAVARNCSQPHLRSRVRRRDSWSLAARAGLRRSQAHPRGRSWADPVEGTLADLGTKEGFLELFAAVDERLGGLDMLYLTPA
jgi:hypothetical protein